ncbi:MAG TPA: dicarboxylate/amino acid:cation symporter, partial [Polyangiales bacterium]
IPSKLVLRLLGALAPALVLFAIIQALINAKLEKGRAGRLVRLLVLNTLVAISIGLLVANVLKPGRWSEQLHPAKDRSAEHADAKPDLLQQFLDNVPQSLLGPLTDDGKVIGVIMLALGFGIALRRQADRPIRTVKEGIDIALETLVVLLHFVIDFVPFAVFGLVASIVGTQGFGAFRALAAFIVTVLVALTVQTSYYLLRIRFGTWVDPFLLLREARDALLMAFSTGSSTVTMPVTFESLKRVGLREESASMGALVGSNFNNDGTALYEAMAALFVSQMLAAQGLGAELTLPQQLMVVVTSVVASVGAAGIPEAGLVTMTLVFHAVGLPVEYIALLLPVDWFLDRCRTVINVLGDMNVSCMLDGQTKQPSNGSIYSNC